MKYGYFDNESKEYVIDRVDLQTSWTNYLGVEDTCVVVNHTAGGYMFYKTPEYHRVTRFRANSVPMYIYVMMYLETIGAFPGSRWGNPLIRLIISADMGCHILHILVIIVILQLSRHYLCQLEMQLNFGM